MTNDRLITITVGKDRKATVWSPQQMLWSEFIERLKTPVRSTETQAEYLKLPKSQQDELKDVGGFVGGTFLGTKRKADSVTDRSLVTLDMDNIPSEMTAQILQRVGALGCGYAVYSTRKHSSFKPRLRVIVPLDRACTADEYEPIARKLAEFIGIEFCDPTTFQASRLMYWPSVSSDGEYVCVSEDKPFLSTDGMLGLYSDWRDITQWAEVPNAPQITKKLAKKQGNPLDKNGVVGAFCKTYNIYTAIEKFLPDVYTPCMDGRFTYAEGSTTGGAVVYDNGNFLYSHHATDPAGGQLCNAFDLVRLHKFAELDDDVKDGTPANRLPSYAKMCELAVADTTVSGLMQKERYDRVTAEFAQGEADVADTDWLSQLQVSPQTGAVAKTVDNIIIIMSNDPLLKGKIQYDGFGNRVLLTGAVAWDKNEEVRRWSDVDDAGLRHYLERAYTITGKDRIYDACALVAKKNTSDTVQSYLKSNEWDGVARLDRLFIDYLGAKDCNYTRQCTRKAFVAAVARAMQPGCKFDVMTILSGPQGIGKSTLLRLMGRSWYSDSLTVFEGKEASEMIQGVWINEIGELSGMNKTELSGVKQFLSKVEDIYREPFGRRTAAFPRRCVFFGTTNDTEYLRDRTGNRRFWPIDCMVQTPTKSVFSDLENEVDMIWAEAYVRWQMGEKLYLDSNTALEAKTVQDSHTESSIKYGMVREFVLKQVPSDWAKRTISQRRAFWANEFGQSAEKLVNRERVCALEVWCECFGGDPKNMRRTDTKEINEIFDGIEELKKSSKAMRFGSEYGVQKGYEML